MSGHMGAIKTYAKAERFYYWPGMFDWICALTADCLTCQNNKPKPKHGTKFHWKISKTKQFLFALCTSITKDLFTQLELVTCTVFLIVDAFFRFLMLYPVRNTTALAIITAVEKRILSLGIPESIIHDRGTAFIKTEFISWTKELGITLRPRTAYSP